MDLQQASHEPASRSAGRVAARFYWWEAPVRGVPLEFMALSLGHHVVVVRRVEASPVIGLSCWFSSFVDSLKPLS